MAAAVKWLALLVLLAGACSGGRATPRPTAVGEMIVDDESPHVLGASIDAALLDSEESNAARRHAIAAAMTDRAFLRRFVDESRFTASLGADPVATLASAVRVRPVGKSRILEVGVALPDRALARTVCNQLIEAFLETSGDRGLHGLDECHATP
jgi:hypothetical protein